MRTLVVSDLHLGIRSGAAVLQKPAVRGALAAHLDGVDQLVLLGDIVELRQGPVREMLGQAVPVLAELGAALGDSKEVVLVPGNHDHRLLGPWRARRDTAPDPSPLGLESAVEWQQDEPLGMLAKALAPARVRVSYPGVWLREDVYAIHGHYLDFHITVPIMERLGAAAMARMVGVSEPSGAEDYQRLLTPMYDWVDAVTAAGGGPRGSIQARVWRDLHGNAGRRRWWRRWPSLALPAGVAVLNRMGFGPLQPDVSGVGLRRAGLRAFDDVLVRLGVRAEHVIFGHTHRAGPLPDDDRAEWTAATGAAMLNLGSWVHMPGFLGPDPQRSPYRPGFAALIQDGRPPELVNLLDQPEVQASISPRRIA